MQVRNSQSDFSSAWNEEWTEWKKFSKLTFSFVFHPLCKHEITDKGNNLAPTIFVSKAALPATAAASTSTSSPNSTFSIAHIFPHFLSIPLSPSLSLSLTHSLSHGNHIYLFVFGFRIFKAHLERETKLKLMHKKSFHGKFMPSYFTERRRG